MAQASSETRCVLNIMLGAGKGGIEQAAVDYAQALRLAGYRVLSVVPPKSWALSALQQAELPAFTLSQQGQWDWLAAWKLARLCRREGVELVLTNGNRAFSLANQAVGRQFPVIGTAQNYQIVRLRKAVAVFATTRDLMREAQTQGIPPERIFYMPNMTAIVPAESSRTRRPPPVIGSMGRWVKKKGFESYLQALAKLRDQGVPFKAVLGGEGEEEASLRELRRKLSLEDQVEFIGWVTDKRVFFDSIDIFCLPSLHEPFGIVLLEAFAHGVPVVTTDAEGPAEIATHEKDALIVPKNNAAHLASALAQLIVDENKAAQIARHALETVQQYTIEAASKRIDAALVSILENWRIS